MEVFNVTHVSKGGWVGEANVPGRKGTDVSVMLLDYLALTFLRGTSIFHSSVKHTHTHTQNGFVE